MAPNRAGSPTGVRRTSRTRKALLTAGQTLFARQPMESVTIDQIVDAAEVAKGSFYNHFADKGELARAVLELVHGDVEFHIFSVNQEIDEPGARIARAVCTVLRYGMEHPDRIQALVSLAARGTRETSPLNKGASADVRHGIERGDFVQIDVETGILAIIGLTNVAVDHAMSCELTGPAVFRLAAASAASVLRALGVDVAGAAETATQAARAVLGDMR